MITVLIVAAYFVVVGIVYARTVDVFDFDSQDLVLAALAGMFWPIMLPVFLGLYIVRTPERRRIAALKAKADRERAWQEVQQKNAEMERRMKVGNEVETQLDRLARVYPTPDELRPRWHRDYWDNPYKS